MHHLFWQMHTSVDISIRNKLACEGYVRMLLPAFQMNRHCREYVGSAQVASDLRNRGRPHPAAVLRSQPRTDAGELEIPEI